MSYTPVQIKCKVLLKGSTLKSLSLKAGLSSHACSVALVKPFPSAEEAIANFLGITAQELWPDRFDAEGNRKHSRLFKYKEKIQFRQCLKRIAA